MKRLDQIIKEHVDRKLAEQRATLVPLTPTSKYDKTNKHIVSKHNIYTAPANADEFGLIPWPSNKLGLWKNSAAQAFINSFPASQKAVAIEPIKVSASLSKMTATKPEYIWKFGGNGYIIRDDNTVETFEHHKVMYWKWLPKGAYRVEITPGLAVNKIPLGIPNKGAIEIRSALSFKSPIIGWIYIETNGEVNFEYFISGIEQDAKNAARQKEEKLLNFLNGIGYIPVAGDAADLVAAAIYFDRYFVRNGTVHDFMLGCLSLVAILPVYGSLIKAGLQRPLKYLMNIRTRNIEEAFKQLAEQRTGKLSEAELKLMHRFLEVATNAVSSTRKTLQQRLLKFGFGDVAETLERVEKTLANSEEYYKLLADKASKKLNKQLDPKLKDIGKQLTSLIYKYTPENSEEAFKRIGKQIAQDVKDVPGGISALPRWLLRNIRRINLRYGQFRSDAIIKNIESAFKRNLIQDPDKFKMFLLMSYKDGTPYLKQALGNFIVAPNIKKLTPDALDLFKSKVKTIEIPVARYQKFADGLDNLQAPKIVTMEKRFITDDTTLDDINKWLGTEITQIVDGKKITNVAKYDIDKTTLTKDINNYVNTAMTEKNPLNSKQSNFPGTAKKIIEEEIKSGKNTLWKSMLADPLAQANALFPRSVKEFANALKGNLLSVKKYIDAFYEGMHEFSQDIGAADDDKIRTSLAYDCIKDMIRPTGWNDNIKDVSRSAGKWLGIIQTITGTKNKKANPDYEFKDVSRDSTWRPLSVPAGSPGTVASTTAMPIKPTYSKPATTSNRRPVFKQGQA